MTAYNNKIEIHNNKRLERKERRLQIAKDNPKLNAKQLAKLIGCGQKAAYGYIRETRPETLRLYRRRRSGKARGFDNPQIKQMIKDGRSIICTANLEAEGNVEYVKDVIDEYNLYHYIEVWNEGVKRDNIFSTKK